MKRGYHFVGETLRDGRPVPPDGVWLVHDGPTVMCQSGLHVSDEPFDALQYAPGPILCLVDYADEVARQADKVLCRRRRIVKRGDATEMLRYFARMQALSVIDKWADSPPDVVLDWLMTGDKSLQSAAGSAAEAAAWSAAEAAAWSAAKSAWSAARSAAWSAESAARSAERAAAVDEFNQLVREFFA